MVKSVAALETEDSQAEVDALFMSIGEGAILTDRAGNISRINQVALDILGMVADDVLNRWIPEVIVLEDEAGRSIPRLGSPITEAFISGKPVFRKLYLRKPNGARIAIAMTVSPVMVNGKPTGSIQVFRDITEEIKLEEAKNEFIAIASHQLRTPATLVKQYLGMLLEGFAGDLTRTQRSFTEIAYQGNDRQLRIIDDILRVAAADSGDLVLKKEKTDLVALMQTVVGNMMSELEASRQKLIFEKSHNRVYADVDKDTFQMVLENLLDNAHKYTHEGKSIFVTICKIGSKVRISIRDQGVGIKKSDQSKLFKKFVRLDNALSITAGGTGLGLYWVKQILHLHNAAIAVQSRKGRGTEFVISMPISK